MKVLVCGGRRFDNYAWLSSYMDSLDDVEIVIQGGALGADALAKRWANERGIHCAEVNAMWSVLGNRAGPARNYAMLSLSPDIVVAFEGGAGTTNMKRIARRAGIPVMEAV